MIKLYSPGELHRSFTTWYEKGHSPDILPESKGPLRHNAKINVGAGLRYVILKSISAMKQNIHPQYYPKAKVRCACGASFTVGSTKPEINVEICSHCHPFYTGKEKFMGIAGKVERFKARQETAKTAKATKAAKMAKLQAKKAKKPRVKKQKK